ncbi:MAG: universal stress protein [Blastocatellia bacterium]
MITIKKILFPTDYSECAEQAFIYAIDLARRFQAELYILHAIVNYTYAGYFSPDQENLYKNLRKNAEYLTEDLVEKYQISDLKVEKLYFPALSASSMIVDYANQFQAGLIIMGTHGRQGLSHLVLGSVAENVIRTANCPVLTIGKSMVIDKDSKLIKNILVPIDFSDHSKQLLSYAMDLAKNYQAKLQLLHVIDTPVYPAFYVMDQMAVTSVAENIKIRVIENLTNLVNELKEPNVKTEVFAVEGRAAKTITQFAEENDNDLILIATHGLTGVERFLLGSVTEKVVRLAKQAVFTIKPKETN